MSTNPTGLQCQHCGSSEFILPDNATDSDEVVCNGCKKVVATVGEVNAEAMRQARALTGIKDFKRR